MMVNIGFNWILPTQIIKVFFMGISHCRKIRNIRPKLKLCWFAVYRPTRGFQCDQIFFSTFKKKTFFFPTRAGKVRILVRCFLFPGIISSCHVFNHVRDPNQLTALNSLFQPRAFL